MRPDGTNAPVVIIGGGPTGLSLALGLARLEVRSILIEREASTSEYSKAPAIHVRTREIFRQWGVERSVLEAGELLPELNIRDAERDDQSLLHVDFRELQHEAEEPGLLILEQGSTESLLLDAVRKMGLCDLRFATEATGIVQDSEGVTVACRHDNSELPLRGLFAVGCDGAGSVTRTALGLQFEGITYELRPVLADIRISDQRDQLRWPRATNRRGAFAFTVRLRPGVWRLVYLASSSPEHEEVTADELQHLVTELLGEGDFETIWGSRFRIHRRSAQTFRNGRVFLAGDAAHVHSPAGGMGMNSGIQDAHNLAWKLARAVRGDSRDSILDSYTIERHAVVAESVSRYADIATRTMLQTPGPVRRAAFWLARRLLSIPSMRSRMVRQTAMLSLPYARSPIIAGTTPTGERLPNARLCDDKGSYIRLHDLLGLHGQIVRVGLADLRQSSLFPEDVLTIGPGGFVDADGTIARFVGDKSAWLLVRPDHHVAWAGEELNYETLRRLSRDGVVWQA